MAERSFTKEVQQLRMGAGETFTGEGILAITKALLESGVGYVGGYQGAPISHLMDVLADAEDILGELGVRFEANASEAAAGATLAASVHYPIRGAVTFKGPVGVNVASDALANLASSGVTGGAMVILGEDYGEGSSIMQERSHGFAMKSQIWLLDPRPNLPSIVDMVKQGFELSEASNTPVMLMVRIRACHVTGAFEASDNQRPTLSVADALANPQRNFERVVLPPYSYIHEQEKITKRLPAARAYIRDHGLNERFGPETGKVGLVIQGGMYNGVIRALQRLGLADISGQTAIPLYVMNVTYPVVPDEFLDFANGVSSLLIVEEGQPEFIEQAFSAELFRAGRTLPVHGKDVFPMAGEYTGAVMLDAITECLKLEAPELLPGPVRAPNAELPQIPDLTPIVPVRPPGFCTGCPERPIFAAMKLVEEDLGQHQISGDIGCNLFSALPPFEIGGQTMGYGLGPASNAAFSGGGEKRAISFLGDGGFWHNGLLSGVTSRLLNGGDGVLVIMKNGYTSATGTQEVISSPDTDMKLRAAEKSATHGETTIEDALKGVGVKWLRTVHTYRVSKMRDTLREAFTTKFKGLKVIVAEGECQLERQRRVKPIRAKALQAGERVVRTRFGIDDDTCTGDHSCIRLSGCPTLTVKTSTDPLKTDPVAHVTNGCVGCGLCGEVAHAATLCPSFWRADIVSNPRWWDRTRAALRRALTGIPA